MGLVHLSCPICAGILEVDESAAGMQIQCPGCLHTITVPSLDAGLALLNPSNSSAQPIPTPHSENVAIAELGCPHCTAVFQVTSEMEGAEVSCPHCQGVVTVPHFSPAQQHDPSNEISSYSPQTSDNIVLDNYSATPSQPLPSSTLPGNARLHLPIGQPTEVDPIGNMLPPQLAASSVAANSWPLPSAHSTVNTSPTAGPEIVLPKSAVAADALAVRTEPTGTLTGTATSKAILIPTEAGYVAVREPVKTVGRPGQEIELRTLSPDERQSRRFHTNLLMIVFCVLLLLFVFFWLK